MMQKVILALALSTAAGVCVDDPFFLDENGNDCSIYTGTDCKNSPISELGISRVLASCQLACDSCVKVRLFVFFLYSRT